MESTQQIGEKGLAESYAEKGDGQHDENVDDAHDLAHLNPRDGGSDGFGAAKIGREVGG
jgi:hypothetical protein